jgi:hypothetical protein
MSKILNRPMFRGGGKVSSYGNGIATGLADGGMPSKRGLVDGPGGYNGLTLDQQRAKINYNKSKKITDSYVTDRFNEYKGNLYTAGIPDIDIDYGMQLIPPMNDERQAQINYMNESPDNFKKDFYEGELDGTNYKQLQSDQLPTATLAGEQDLYKLLNKETAKKDEPTQRTEAEIEADLLKKLQGKELTEGEELAALEKEQAFFEKVMGGGKAAMIDDLSTMGLNYASGALKEGATVKSSFADFFEKEAKRPSRRMKVKDAATQAAIQSYLTGKTSLQKFQNELDGYGVKMKMKSDIEKKAEENMPFVKIKNSLSGNMKDREKTKAAAELYVSAREKNTGKGLTIIDDVDDTSVLLASPENEGQYFMNKDTKQVFKIVEGIKQIIYGG